MVPAHRNSKSKSRRRRAHLALGATNTNICANCQSAILSHRACTNCGMYKGRMVIDVFKGLSKKERKAKEKQLATTQ